MEKLAIHGGVPVRGSGKAWPRWPVWDERERCALLEVLESGKWNYGERVHAFETAFAAFQQADRCVTATSGTTALETCLLALGIGPGDEVIVPPYTFMATASVVLRVGATPVFADVDAGTFCLDPAAASDAVTPRTRALMPVHFGGLMADMDALRNLAARHDLLIIEDACHAWGTVWRDGTGAGAVGDCGCFSFQMSKNITAGEGGAVVSNNAELAERCRSYTNCGRGADTGWYQHFLMGSNLRMTEFQAAILSAQLTRLPEQVALREKNAARLNEWLAEVPGLHPTPRGDNLLRRSYHLYCIRFEPEEFGCPRQAFIRAAAAEGVSFSPGYPLPLYRQPMFTERPGPPDYRNISCPNTEKLCAESAMWLPHTLLLATERDMADIVEVCRKVHRHVDELGG